MDMPPMGQGRGGSVVFPRPMGKEPEFVTGMAVAFGIWQPNGAESRPSRCTRRLNRAQGLTIDTGLG